MTPRTDSARAVADTNVVPFPLQRNQPVTDVSVLTVSSTPEEIDAALIFAFRRLAASQIDLDPVAKHVLYSRMSELYIR